MVFDPEFEKALVESVDHVLRTLSASSKPTIYRRLMTSYRIRRQDIPRRMEDFHTVLTDVMGTGALTVERLIAQELYRRLGLTFLGHEKWSLIDYFENAKTLMASSPSQDYAMNTNVKQERTPSD